MMGRRCTEGDKMTTSPGSKVFNMVAIGFGILCISQAALNVCLRLAGSVFEGVDEVRNLTEHRDNLLRNLSDIEKGILDKEARLKSLTEQRAELITTLGDLIKTYYIQKGWIYFDGSLYYISNRQETWGNSRKYCVKNKADLMIIDSKEEQNFTTTLKDNMWIGLTDREQEGTWRWVDGTLLNTSYWIPNEPNSYAETEEDCVEVRYHEKEKNWNDKPCINANHWVCEKKLPV